MSDFITVAIREKLAKMARCRRPRHARPFSIADETETAIENELAHLDLLDTEDTIA
jgi:hypothetical protein